MDLVAEMHAAVEAMELQDFAQLRALGETRQITGIGRVRDIGDGLYEPEESPWGHWRWITPVCVQWHDTPESDDPESHLGGPPIDLIAWHEATPDSWLARTGHAHWLGRIEQQYWGPEPVKILRSPLSWIRNGCVGLVPLCRNRADRYWLLRLCSSGVIAEDPEHAAELNSILEYPLPRPPVYV